MNKAKQQASRNAIAVYRYDRRDVDTHNEGYAATAPGTENPYDPEEFPIRHAAWAMGRASALRKEYEKHPENFGKVAA